MSKNRLCIVLFMAVLMSGCAAGHRIDYRQAVPVINISTDNEVTVLVIDERPYVISQRKGVNFLGNSRALYYNPFKVTTVSGNSLAIDLQAAIIDGLKRNGVHARHRTTVDVLSDRVEQRLLLVTIKEWKVDVYMRARFDYNITATVEDGQGNVVGVSHKKGSASISNFLIAGSDVLQAVLDDKKIKIALTSQVSKNLIEQAPTVRLNSSGSAYDDCMVRVMRISDSSLRLKAMAACDGVQ